MRRCLSRRPAVRARERARLGNDRAYRLIDRRDQDRSGWSASASFHARRIQEPLSHSLRTLAVTSIGLRALLPLAVWVLGTLPGGTALGASSAPTVPAVPPGVPIPAVV